MKREPEPELIIDEDWKTKVQREKQQLQEQKSQEPKPQDAQESPTAATPQAADPSTNHDDLNSADQAPPPPPASFEFMVTTLATQAVAAMGQLPEREGQNTPVRLDYAQHFIDMLGLLETKTAGNLSQDEQRYLQASLHQLRMLFVSIKK
jgi:hypothetical protein